jgi:O-antigen ligase
MASGAAVFGAAIYLAWHAEPAWTFTVGLGLSVFGGHWQYMGFPSNVLAPDRVVLATGVVAVLLRGPALRRRGRLKLEPVHYLMILTVLYVAVSGLIVGTVAKSDGFFVLVERFGIVPFLIFVCSPYVFRTERDRDVLLGGLVIIGGYLGLIALFETLKIPLIVPRYITDPSIGILPDRARGPFLEPATNGLALFTGAAACMVALGRWRSSLARFAAGSVGLLCAAGVFFTLTRQVWLAATVATTVGVLSMPRVRGALIPLVIVAALGVSVLLNVVPGLSEKVQARRNQQDTLWDRNNLNRAALNAINAHPLFGVGWQNFTKQGDQYAQLNPAYPLTAVGTVNVHNLFLSYGSELGLVGLLLWGGVLALGVGATLMRRGPPELRAWWALGLSASAFFLVIGTFEFPQSFASFAIWMLVGAVRAGQLGAAGRRGAVGGASA